MAESIRMKHASLVALLIALAACSDEPADEQRISGDAAGTQLDRAAEQSGPAAANVLKDAADEARGRESVAPLDEPGSLAQEAAEEAGKAEAAAAGKAATIRPPEK
jgi:hypothetical protein